MYVRYVVSALVGAFLISAAGYAFYYTQVIIPHREHFGLYAAELAKLRLNWDDKLAICTTDPELKDPQSWEQMENLQKKSKDILDPFIEQMAYNISVIPDKNNKAIDQFLQWHWKNYFYIEAHHKCPTDFRTPSDGDKLREWQNGMTHEFPRYWFF